MISLIYKLTNSIYNTIHKAVLEGIPVERVFVKYLKKGSESLNLLEKIVLSDNFSENGFRIPEDIAKKMWDSVFIQTVIYPEAQEIIVPENSDRHIICDEQGEPIHTFPIHTMLIALTSTTTSLQDNTFSIIAEITEAFGEAIAISADQLSISGDGQGKTMGITLDPRTNVTGVRLDEVGEFSTEAIETMKEFLKNVVDENDYPELIKIPLSDKTQELREKYKHLSWIMNSNTGLTISTKKDSQDEYVIDIRDESMRTIGIPDYFFGIRAIYNEWTPNIADDQHPIILADLSKYTFIRQEQIHITQTPRRNVDKIDFIMKVQISGGVNDFDGFQVLKTLPYKPEVTETLKIS